MTPVEQTLIMFGLMIGLALTIAGIAKGLGWLWKKIKAVFSGAPAKAAAIVVVVVAAGAALSPREQAAAQQQVDQLRQRGVDSRVVTLTSDEALRLLRAAQAESKLTVKTIDDPLGDGGPPTLHVVEGDGDELDEVLEEPDTDSSRGFVHGIEGIDF